MEKEETRGGRESEKERESERGREKERERNLLIWKRVLPAPTDSTVFQQDNNRVYRNLVLAYSTQESGCWILLSKALFVFC